MTRFEPISAIPLRATHAVLEADDAIPMPDHVDYADWGTGPIDVGHVLAGDLDTLRSLVATPGRAYYSRVGPRRRSPRRSSYQAVGGRDVVIPTLRWLNPADRMRTIGVAAAALLAAASWAMAALQGMVPL